MAIPSRGIHGLGEGRDNLPRQPGPLIGREREVEAARCRWLDVDVRLLTLTGPGGTGKTRLALAVAAAVLEQFEHGACFVELAPIRDPALVGAAIARSLGLHGAGGQPLLERLKRFLARRELLLVLDNFERLQAAAMPSWRSSRRRGAPPCAPARRRTPGGSSPTGPSPAAAPAR
ncbi:MAG: AAA family ATPase [Chloroflexi bacterium]|nr:AAA family ATPase [Chloroflexota bacterium]